MVLLYMYLAVSLSSYGCHLEFGQDSRTTHTCEHEVMKWCSQLHLEQFLPSTIHTLYLGVFRQMASIQQSNNTNITGTYTCTLYMHSTYAYTAIKFFMYLVHSDWLPIHLYHVHHFDGIISILLAKKFNEPITLMQLGDTIFRHVNIH